MMQERIFFRRLISVASCWAVLPFCLFINSMTANDSLLGILATVNGEAITLYDVLSETQAAEERQAGIDDNEALRDSVLELRRAAVDRIIARKLFREEFEKRGYRVPEQLVEDMLDEIAANVADGSREELVKRVLMDGSSMDALRRNTLERASAELLVNELCRRPVNISPRELHDYYLANPEEFSEEEQISLQLLLIRKDGRYRDSYRDTVRRIHAEVEPADEAVFSTLVKLYSEGPAVDDGGRSGWLPTSALRREFVELLKHSRPAGIYGPVETEEGTFFIRVVRRVSARKLPFPAVKEKIRDVLISRERDVRYERELNKLRQAAVIRYFF